MQSTEILPNFSATEHNKLGHIDVAQNYDMEKYATDIIIEMNEGLGEFKYGIARLHKHFELKGNECVVITFDP